LAANWRLLRYAHENYMSGSESIFGKEDLPYMGGFEKVHMNVYTTTERLRIDVRGAAGIPAAAVLAVGVLADPQLPSPAPAV
jgi:hypothetical protein